MFDNIFLEFHALLGRELTDLQKQQITDFSTRNDGTLLRPHDVAAMLCYLVRCGMPLSQVMDITQSKGHKELSLIVRLTEFGFITPFALSK